MLSLCVIFGQWGWRTQWALHGAAASWWMCVCVCVGKDTRAREFSLFHLNCLCPCMEVNINDPKVYLRVCACKCVNMSASKSLKLTTVALHCSELYTEKERERPTQTRIFVSKTSAFIYNYSRNTSTELYVCCKSVENSDGSANLSGAARISYVRQLWPNTWENTWAAHLEGHHTTQVRQALLLKTLSEPCFHRMTVSPSYLRDLRL